MIAKKGYCLLVKTRTLLKFVDGIVVPEKRNPENNEEVVVGFGIDTKPNDLQYGDRVVFEIDYSTTTTIGFNGADMVSRKLDKISGIVGHEDLIDINKNNDVPVIHDVSSEKKVSAVGDKIVIKRKEIKGYYKSGDLFIPYERRELGRANDGTVIAITKEMEELTGIKVGMQVLYDYNASFGHSFDFDVVKEESVFMILSEMDEKILDKSREEV